MCIAILQKNPKNLIKKESLENSYASNPDGIGISYIDKKTNKIVTKKYFDFEKFYIDYVKSCNKSKSPVMIHFRLASSGLIDYTNCHPFYNDEFAFCHNGILYGMGNKDASDTNIFYNNILKNIDINKNKSFLDGYAKSNHSKFIFLNKDGSFFISNESAGHWKNNVWYSNNSYMSYSDYNKSYMFDDYDNIDKEIDELDNMLINNEINSIDYDIEYQNILDKYKYLNDSQWK